MGTLHVLVAIRRAIAAGTPLLQGSAITKG